MATIDLELAYKNVNTRVVASNGATDKNRLSFSAMLTSPFILAGSSRYNSLLETESQESLQQTLQKASATLGNFGINTSLASPKTAQQTVSTWSNTEKLGFTLSVVFIALRESDDVRAQVSSIYKAVFPQFQGTQEKGNSIASFIRPPLDYQPQGLVGLNTITVQIGKWFRGTGFLITNVSFEFSKEVIRSGAPLYAEGSITFEHYRIISYDEFNSFIGGS